MARFKKGFNWRARQKSAKSAPVTKDETLKTTVTEVEGEKNNYGTDHSGSNSLIVENKTENTSNKPESEHMKVKKKLSKSQRKRLEKIVEKKQKKARRAGLLEELEQHAVSEKELALMSSSCQLGQLERKRKPQESNELLVDQEKMTDQVISSVKKGRKKGKRIRLMKKANNPAPQSSKIEDASLELDESDDSDDSSGDDLDGGELDTEKQINNNEQESVNDEVTKCDEMQDETSLVSKDNNELVNEAEESKTHSDDKVKSRSSCKSKPMPAVFMEVKRDPEIQASRLQLPILAEEQAVMEAINENSVVILCGETGSGKTTQVPQFLYEAGYTRKGLIGVTEPRRVAAVSMSQRVAKEMSMDTSKVSYQIRYQGNTSDNTMIKFMTDGVMLKEVESDFLLTKYSVVIIDEAHERSVYTDILIGLLSRIVPLRAKQGNELKLVIMSATLRVEDFTSNAKLFPTPPMEVKVDSRQFPVTIHFNKRTPDDYVEETFRKVCKIHRTLPSGGILLFVTGQSEIHGLCKRLRRTFPYKKRNERNEKDEQEDDEFDLDNYPVKPMVEDHDAEDEDLGEEHRDDDDDFNDDDSAFTSSVDHNLPLYVLPLYSLLSSKEQAKVFQSVPEGARLCVVATNVAETSLTIPNIKYVVDAGMVKRRYYDKVTGVSSFKITWTSQASANQRAGRAGRMEPGHCYRLYSSAVFTNDFEKFAEADISRRPVDDLMLQMKSMSINKVVNFPFPTPPSADALQAAEKLLINLGALEEKKTTKGNTIAVITAIGSAMSKFPISPRYGKMLCLGHQGDSMEFIIAIISALTVKEIFVDDIKETGFTGDKEDFLKRRAQITKLRRSWAGFGEAQRLGDVMVLLRAVGACEYAGCTEKFCHENGLRHKGMVEIRKLRTQLTNTVNLVNPDAKVALNPQMPPPSVEQCKAIRQICLAGLGDHVARKIPAGEITDPKMKNAYVCTSLEEPVFIHPKSALFSVLPEYVVYQEIMETSKLFMKGVTAIESEWLPTLVPSQCVFSKPAEHPPPHYDADTGTVKCHMSCAFGVRSWQIPAQELDYPPGLEKYKRFAMFLLEGQVISTLQKFTPLLLSSPSTMVKSWAKLQPRTQVFLSELVSENVDSRSALEQAWKKDNKFLLSAYAQWLPQSKHKQLAARWPPVSV